MADEDGVGAGAGADDHGPDVKVVMVGSSTSNGTDTSDAEWPAMPVDRLYTLAAIMAVALVGNCIIVVTLTCTRYVAVVGGGQTSSRRVSMFILNLAISDLAVCLITIPGEMVFTVFGEWILGAVACKLLVYGQIVALAGTIFNLAAMSYDRYLAVCQPLRFRSNNVSRARRTIAVAWSLAFLLSVPQLFIFVQVRRAAAVHDDGSAVYDCASQGYTAWWQRRVYFSCLTLCILVLPAALITFCYVSIVRVVWQQGRLETVVVVEMSRTTSASSASSSLARGSKLSLRKSVNNDRHQSSRAKVRTIKLTLCIILTFVTCWSPYFVINNIRIHSHYEAPIPASVRVMAETVGLVNSALNPIIYFCFNMRMKKALRNIRCSCCHFSRCFCRRDGGNIGGGYDDDYEDYDDDDDDDVHGGHQSNSSSGGGGGGDGRRNGQQRQRRRRRRRRRRRCRPQFYTGMGSMLRSAVVANFRTNNSAPSDFSSSCAEDVTSVLQVSGSLKAIDSCSTTPSSLRTVPTTGRSSVVAVLDDFAPPPSSSFNGPVTVANNSKDYDVRVAPDDPLTCELIEC